MYPNTIGNVPYQQVAYGLIVASYRRRMGVIAVREMARHRESQFAGLTRLQLDEVGRERQVQQQSSSRGGSGRRRSCSVYNLLIGIARRPI